MWNLTIGFILGVFITVIVTIIFAKVYIANLKKLEKKKQEAEKRKIREEALLREFNELFN